MTCFLENNQYTNYIIFINDDYKLNINNFLYIIIFSIMIYKRIIKIHDINNIFN